jgi:hypothetical protein
MFDLVKFELKTGYWKILISHITSYVDYGHAEFVTFFKWIALAVYVFFPILTDSSSVTNID